MAHLNALHIGENEHNAVGIVAHQIGVHTIFGDRFSLGIGRAGGEQQFGAEIFKRVR